jgi:predicted sulfurtransferase
MTWNDDEVCACGAKPHCRYCGTYFCLECWFAVRNDPPEPEVPWCAKCSEPGVGKTFNGHNYCFKCYKQVSSYESEDRRQYRKYQERLKRERAKREEEAERAKAFGVRPCNLFDAYSMGKR